MKDVGRVLMSLYNDKDAAVRELAQTAIGHFVCLLESLLSTSPGFRLGVLVPRRPYLG